VQTTRSIPLVLLGWLVLASAAPAAATPITVAGSSDVWLSGMADGARASRVDSAPHQSPVFVRGLDLTPGQLLTFTVTGGVMNFGGCPPVCDGPDGARVLRHDEGAENGLANVVAPLNSLLGVFLGDFSPHLEVAPRELDFDFGGFGLNFLTIAPELRQIFFIGDGRTITNRVQHFVVPFGATRLFLGTMDGFEWSNNSGSFEVEISTVPEPATLLLVGAGLAALRRRWRCRT
jgi:hypothetical protein